MYYKQISEGFNDRARFDILRKVGMNDREIRRAVNSQVLTVFFAPLIAAGIHMAFAFPLLTTRSVQHEGRRIPRDSYADMLRGVRRAVCRGIRADLPQLLQDSQRKQQMRRAVRGLCFALLAVAAVPAGACFGVLWAVFRLTDAILRKTERSNDEG